MIEVTFVEACGKRITVQAAEGATLMQIARDNDVEGIRGECGGSLACATCHGYVEDTFLPEVGGAGEEESEMLDFAACEVKPSSRLCCQIAVRPALNGMVVHLPEAQI
ncbi:2Fe-2S iron-sulfur cluster-binding protein [Psychromarinibacter halotolerans]|mgnify:CR=1 FL=1|uniref:2Fe-2S iron-sulfur cluster-binding protein n=1 Tax=Psychromarinibacter halotolerans TaxID=1775175 RepID=A0ABV7GWB2_9RHOB|nr:2Fe-2S iron-sulfur cluster-binding protein [Psychromarinibacter halotolerans]MAQ81998.1 (2Fe-2S)-binding protein [Maritimibacter sp.]MDF0598780.1 2Fe-2S iron-sulfur cluster-binding protein [Psychromarinibacter halotolerans]